MRRVILKVKKDVFEEIQGYSDFNVMSAREYLSRIIEQMFVKKRRKKSFFRIR